MEPKKPRLLVWGHCRLGKRGSFEGYVCRMVARAIGAGWNVRVAAEDWSPDIEAECRALGAETSRIPGGRAAGIARFITEAVVFRPDIVHCHFGSPSSAKGVLLRLVTLGGARMVVTNHTSRPCPSSGDVVSGPMAAAKGARRRILSRCVDLHLPVSGFVAKRLAAELEPRAGSVATLLNGVDVSRCFPVKDSAARREMRSSIGIPGVDQVVLFVGQLAEFKGVPDLLIAQERVLAERPGSGFVWVGDGPLRGTVAAAATRHPGRVAFLGQRDDVPALMQAADLVAAPSRWDEAFCLALAEAAASGVPSVATRVGGIPEVVDDGVTGLLVPRGDAVALASAISDLLGDSSRLSSMGIAARARAERLFDLDRMVEVTMEHYRGLLPVVRSRKAGQR